MNITTALGVPSVGVLPDFIDDINGNLSRVHEVESPRVGETYIPVVQTEEERQARECLMRSFRDPNLFGKTLRFRLTPFGMDEVNEQGIPDTMFVERTLVSDDVEGVVIIATFRPSDVPPKEGDCLVHSMQGHEDLLCFRYVTDFIDESVYETVAYQMLVKGVKAEGKDIGFDKRRKPKTGLYLRFEAIADVEIIE